MLQDISMVALDILDDSNDRTNNNQNTRAVQDVYVFPENVVKRVGLGGRIFRNTEPEDQGAHDKEAEEDDLDEETT